MALRGGDTISYLGFNVAMRPWVEKNGETIEKFLAAVSEADKWMRANPKLAAQVATRWIPGLKPDVAEAAMTFNIQQADRRLSANNFRALWSAQDRLSRLGVIKSTFDVNKHIEASQANWEAIVAGTADESITLITCGGEFSAGHYSDRRILWGRRVT